MNKMRAKEVNGDYFSNGRHLFGFQIVWYLNAIQKPNLKCLVVIRMFLNKMEAILGIPLCPAKLKLEPSLLLVKYWSRYSLNELIDEVLDIL